MKLDEADLQNSIDSLSSQRATMNQEIADTKTGILLLREELLKLEKEIVDAKEVKVKEMVVQTAVFDGHQKVIATGTERLNVLADEIEKRGFALDDREKTLKDSQALIEDERTNIIAERDRIAQRESEIAALMTSAMQSKKDAEEKSAQSGELILKAKNDISSAETTKQNTASMLASNDDKLNRALKSEEEIRGQAKLNETILKQVQSLIPVFTELRYYILNHVNDRDGVEALLQSKLPELFTAAPALEPPPPPPTPENDGN